MTANATEWHSGAAPEQFTGAFHLVLWAVALITLAMAAAAHSMLRPRR
ncbi:hypothetical protein [Nonomuraea africana]